MNFEICFNTVSESERNSTRSANFRHLNLSRNSESFIGHNAFELVTIKNPFYSDQNISLPIIHVLRSKNSCFTPKRRVLFLNSLKASWNNLRLSSLFFYSQRDLNIDKISITNSVHFILQLIAMISDSFLGNNSESLMRLRGSLYISDEPALEDIYARISLFICDIFTKKGPYRLYRSSQYSYQEIDLLLKLRPGKLVLTYFKSNFQKHTALPSSSYVFQES